MKYIIYNLEGTRIVIALNDNPFVHKWYDKFKCCIEKTGSQTTLQQHPDIQMKYQVEECFLKLKTVVQKIESITHDYLFDFSLGMPSQNQLNRLHRYFTSISFQYADQYVEETFYKDSEMEQVLRLTEDLNNILHLLEVYTETDRKKQSTGSISSVVTKQDDDLNVYWTYFTEEDKLYFDDRDETDVWLGVDILGKNYIQAFYDNEDPREWDVTAPLGYNVKIEIDVDDTRSKFMKSVPVQKWLSDHNVIYNSSMVGMPLGKIVEGKNDLITLVREKTSPFLWSKMFDTQTIEFKEE